MLFVEKLVKSIVENKDMPKVQVEREISPILEIFIEDIINEFSKLENNMDEGDYKFIAPEFPLQSKKLENNTITNRSTNVDFLFLNKTSNDLYFVELKTDSSSFKYEQFKIYDEIITDRTITPEMLYNFLSENLTSKKYISLKKHILKSMSYNDESKENPFHKVKNIKLIYISPRRMFERNWKGDNLEAIKKINKHHTKIFFNELQNIKVSKYEEEWKIISKEIAKLDEN